MLDLQKDPHVNSDGPVRSKRRAPWFWQRGYSRLEFATTFAGGTLLLIGLFVQFVIGSDVPGYTMVFVGIITLGGTLTRDWLIARREEAAHR